MAPASPDSGARMSGEFASICCGCGHKFQPGDVRLRFLLNEWERYQGLPETPDVGLGDIGLCVDCSDPGDFKNAEIVPAGQG